MTGSGGIWGVDVDEELKGRGIGSVGGRGGNDEVDMEVGMGGDE